MISVRRLAVTAAVVMGMALCALAQDAPKPGVVSAASTKLAPLPVFPSCLTLAPQRGDPFKGPAVILIKMTSGCQVVWHWHTANEALMMVSGKGKVEMRDEGSSSPVAPGDYVYLPGKHVHQFTCSAACTFFDVTEGVFDIHYVDKDGKEIPVDQVVKPAAKPAGKP